MGGSQDERGRGCVVQVGMDRMGRGERGSGRGGEGREEEYAICEK